MDIRRVEIEPTAAEREAIDALLGAPASSWDGGERGDPRDGHVSTVGGHDSRALRHLLLPALQALQSSIGWISEGGLGYVCDRLNVPPADAWGVATFYALLATSPRPPRIVHVCDDIACKCRGADAVVAELERTVGPALSHGDQASVAAPSSAWMRSPCLGKCDQAPAAFVTIAGEEPREVLIGHVTAERIRGILAGQAPELSIERPQLRQPSEQLTLLRRIGRTDPESLDAYRASGGFAALEKARAIGPEAVIAEVTASKLMGRGGAAFPTGRKWEAVRVQPATPHYLICNADESEPGTFKDRVLMEGDPFAIVEAMAIAALATGCEKGFIYIRGEYPLATARLRNAINASRRAGLLPGFEIEIRRGGGAYICGEETAIFESIEGGRGEPRNKPPFPVEVGLFGKPTVVNNVETPANIPRIVLEGGEACAAVGTDGSTGSKLFCLSGHVARPGTYEVEFGATLRDLIDLAGGVPGGRGIRAILLGGAAGVFVGPEALDMPLTFEATRAAGATLGSGVIMVFDETVDLVDTLRRIAQFFRDESCGQCVPCRIGSVRQEELLARLAAGSHVRPREEELALLREIGQAMRDASICGLGQTASSAIESVFRQPGMVAL